MATQIYKIWSEIWVAPYHRNWHPEAPKFPHNFTQFCDLITNIFGTQQDIVSRKTALQTTDTSAAANLIQYTLVHKW